MNRTCRRQFLCQSVGGLANVGLGSVALSWMLNHEAAASRPRSLAPKSPHFAPRAKSILFLMMEGGPSQIDTFDPKPELQKVDGQQFQRQNVKTSQVSGKRYFNRSPFKFRRYGECGMDVSELFQHTAAHVDDIAFLRSGYCDSDNHPAAVFQYTTGYPVQGNPSIGSWVVYGLGTENENLPAYVVLRDGKPFGGTTSWGNGFLPALYQGVQFRGGDRPVLNLEPPDGLSTSQQRETLGLLQRLNRAHQLDRSEFSDLEARIAAYDLAFRMQSRIPDLIDVERESAGTHALYGLDKTPPGRSGLGACWPGE